MYRQSMKYVFVNLFFMEIMLYTVNLSASSEPEENKQEESEEYKPDYDQIAREVERDAEVHDSWDSWGFGR